MDLYYKKRNQYETFVEHFERRPFLLCSISTSKRFEDLGKQFKKDRM